MQNHGIYSYAFQYRAKGTSTWKVADTKITSSSSCTYTYINLSEGQEYELNVIIKDKAGNSKTSETKVIATVDSSAPESATVRINGVKGNEDWYRSNVSIIITPGNDTGAGVKGVGYEVLKVDTENVRVTEPANLGSVIKFKDTKSTYISERQVQTTGATSVEIKENGKYIIRAYTVDNSGHKSQVSELEFKIDLSEAKLGEFTTGLVGAKTAEVSVKAIDSETGIAAYYFDYQKQGSTSWATQYVANTSERSYEYKYTNLTEGTVYNLRVRILDKAGNITSPQETEWKRITTQASNQLPTISQSGIKVKVETLNGLVFGLTGYDSNGDKLTYTLYKNVSVNGQTQRQVVATDTAVQGKEVTFAITGLEPDSQYSWNLMITDGTGTVYPTISVTGRTLCTGTGYWCEGPFQTWHICETCGGRGYYYYTNAQNQQIRVECTKGWYVATPCRHGKYSTHQMCEHDQIIVHSQNDYGSNIVEASTCSGPNSNNKVTCTACSGRGVFLDGNDETICSKCKGSGKVAETVCIHGETSSHKYSVRS